MELMLIVWLVSILSTIKEFVGEYLLFVVLALLSVFVLHRINKSFVEHKRTTVSLSDGYHTTLTAASLAGKHVPKGTSLLIDKFTSYAYVTNESLGLARERIDIQTLMVAFTSHGSSETVIPLITDSAYKPTTYLLYLMIALNIFLPSDTTMKYMAGAYLLQSTYQSDFVQQAIPLSQKAVLNQLNRWAEDSTELKNLLLENQNEGAKGN